MLWLDYNEYVFTDDAQEIPIQCCCCVDFEQQIISIDYWMREKDEIKSNMGFCYFHISK